ncbi:Alcohol dehydrogenase [Pseudomonas ogarae]|uniref:alcohol dehydrogenase catalytic domain-containing protein n=1 Tax=Pseudomonas ogarae (strain DSM 112162 / CECT 30235 / F113) TaxID=1114970 RepID=UPI000BB34AC3|nr:alcohol dehydrogenase catalytic domain-containing protein [Pseudomonas ogarae]PBJ19923.1 Alcohol dehydrogenase [Pseudomonas ogarae]
MSYSMMRAARMHAIGSPMSIDNVERPAPQATDVLVEVKACGMVPNLGNVLASWPTWCPHLPLPALPAVFGLDPAGVIVEVGSQVIGLKPGDRVYVSPVRSCGACPACLSDNRVACEYFVFNGYFGFSKERSQTIYDLYPHGGFCEYMAAPQHAIVKLADNISFEEAVRLGYLGTGYSALRKCGPLAGKTLIINGISGTLGLGITLLALAMGVTKILGSGRNQVLLDRVKALSPGRIEVFSTDDGSTGQWVRSRTGGHGADFMIDALGAAVSLDVFDDAMQGVGRGGTIVNVGGTVGKLAIDMKWLMDNSMTLIGSAWFTAAEGYDVVEMIRTKTIDLSILQHEVAQLQDINEAISGLGARHGGFSNYVIVP